MAEDSQVVNIYEDLDRFQEDIDFEQLASYCKQLEETLKGLRAEHEEAKMKKRVLEVNISQLYKTAKQEVDRKDNTIRELRKQVDNLTEQLNNQRKLAAVLPTHVHQAENVQDRLKHRSPKRDMTNGHHAKDHRDHRDHRSQKRRRSRSRSRSRSPHRSHKYHKPYKPHSRH